jgi:hypothetical protein
VNDRSAYAIDRSAQRKGSLERGGGLFPAPPSFTRKRLRFVLDEQSRAQAPRQKIDVIVQLVSPRDRRERIALISRRVGIPPAYRVHKIQAQSPAKQIHLRRRPFSEVHESHFSVTNKNSLTGYRDRFML